MMGALVKKQSPLLFIVYGDNILNKRVFSMLTGTLVSEKLKNIVIIIKYALFCHLGGTKSW